MTDLTDFAVNEALRAAGLDFAAGHATVEDNALRTDKLVKIELRYHDITFEELQEISKALGTTKINLDSETREGGYCDTCRYSYSITVLTAMDVRLPDGPEQA